MKRSPIHWNRYVPLGMDGIKRKNQMATMLGVGIGGSLIFPIKYCSARSSLFGYVNGKYQRITRNRMLPFEELLPGTFTIMAIAALGFVIAAVLFYLYNYQGCRSIYTMKRLPDQWDLWRRCRLLPIVFLLLSAVCTVMLTGLYWLLGRFATPADAFPL